MSNKEEIKNTEVEEKKLTDEELENVSGGKAQITKKIVTPGGATIQPVTKTTTTS